MVAGLTDDAMAMAIANVVEKVAEQAAYSPSKSELKYAMRKIVLHIYRIAEAVPVEYLLAITTGTMSPSSQRQACRFPLGRPEFICQHPPDTLGDTFEKGIKSVEERRVYPPQPLQKHNPSEIKVAIRFMQNRKAYRKDRCRNEAWRWI
ncbi:MAG: hypothetical protein M1813_008589 [Trichoglossum hirsutum]|nr:MAG: hypothetical protein M1813_008589 [Trichoglossum hirsutum]